MLNFTCLFIIMSISVKRHELWCTVRDMRLSKCSIIIIIIIIFVSDIICLIQCSIRFCQLIAISMFEGKTMSAEVICNDYLFDVLLLLLIYIVIISYIIILYIVMISANTRTVLTNMEPIIPSPPSCRQIPVYLCPPEIDRL